MKILVPIDGSAGSMAGLAHAVALRRAGLEVDFVLVNAQPPSSLYEVVTAHDADRLEEVRRGAGADLLAPAEALLDAEGASWESEVVGGEPAHALVDVAENYGCDAIVIGVDEDGPGSVVEALLAHAAMPVTVVRDARAEAPAAEAAGEDGVLG
jgi:nucleotide-binding universal stress UspA family protein